MNLRQLVIATVSAASIVSMPVVAQPALTPAGAQPAQPSDDDSGRPRLPRSNAAQPATPATPAPGALGASGAAAGTLSGYVGLGLLGAIAVGGFAAANNSVTTGTGTR